jgi:hypothetical protein
VDTYGINLVATLCYKASHAPGLDVFEKRNWLILTHHSFPAEMDLHYVMTRFKTVKDRFVHIGRIPLRTTDPHEASGYVSWPYITTQMYIQDRWERGIRE